ncbi:hypothetical protein QBC47DRAFT_377097 [Echria macrotheca]|uniref:Secreted protein n=1 Tax=Echria macrotheca TaxID=438768 RepID=A0AAJ0FC08_9PEZI|nr:hypothetical protein QBC47DRAFT_377097 [Echria macrotheca]
MQRVSCIYLLVWTLKVVHHTPSQCVEFLGRPQELRGSLYRRSSPTKIACISCFCQFSSHRLTKHGRQWLDVNFNFATASYTMQYQPQQPSSPNA